MYRIVGNCNTTRPESCKTSHVWLTYHPRHVFTVKGMAVLACLHNKAFIHKRMSVVLSYGIVSNIFQTIS